MRNQGQQKVTEKTDMSKVKLPDFIKNKPEEPTFVSKVKTKR